MKIFIINLKKSVERRKHMEKQLKRLNLDYEFIDAIDGRSLSDEALREISNLDNYMKHPTWQNRGKGLIGCALSHQAVYKAMVKQNIPRALVLEDDIFIKKEMGELLKKIDVMSDIGNKELILFETESSYGKPIRLSSSNKRSLIKGYDLLCPIDTHDIWLASAYSITFESAKRFLEVYPKVERVADVWGAFYDKDIFSIISCVTPFVVHQGVFESSIGSYVSEKTLKSKIKYFIRKVSPTLYLTLVKMKSTRDNKMKQRYMVIDESSIFYSVTNEES